MFTYINRGAVMADPAGTRLDGWYPDDDDPSKFLLVLDGTARAKVWPVRGKWRSSVTDVEYPTAVAAMQLNACLNQPA